MTVEQGPIKAVFFFHLVLTSWGLLTSWLPGAYLYYNSFFLLTVLWSIHSRDKDEPVFMALIMDLISVFLDIFLVSVYYYPSREWSDLWRFGAGMCILNLILRPLSLYILFRVYRERTGNYGTLGIPGLDNYFTGNQHDGPYEDIDRNPNYPQSVPQNAMDTGSPAHHGSHPDEKPVIP